MKSRHKSQVQYCRNSNWNIVPSRKFVVLSSMPRKTNRRRKTHLVKKEANRTILTQKTSYSIFKTIFWVWSSKATTKQMSARRNSIVRKAIWWVLKYYKTTRKEVSKMKMLISCLTHNWSIQIQRKKKEYLIHQLFQIKNKKKLKCLNLEKIIWICPHITKRLYLCRNLWNRKRKINILFKAKVHISHRLRYIIKLRRKFFQMEIKECSWVISMTELCPNHIKNTKKEVLKRIKQNGQMLMKYCMNNWKGNICRRNSRKYTNENICRKDWWHLKVKIMHSTHDQIIIEELWGNPWRFILLILVATTFTNHTNKLSTYQDAMFLFSNDR